MDSLVAAVASAGRAAELVEHANHALTKTSELFQFGGPVIGIEQEKYLIPARDIQKLKENRSKYVQSKLQIVLETVNDLLQKLQKMKQSHEDQRRRMSMELHHESQEASKRIRNERASILNNLRHQKEQQSNNLQMTLSKCHKLHDEVESLIQKEEELQTEKVSTDSNQINLTTIRVARQEVEGLATQLDNLNTEIRKVVQQIQNADAESAELHAQITNSTISSNSLSAKKQKLLNESPGNNEFGHDKELEQNAVQELELSVARLRAQIETQKELSRRNGAASAHLKVQEQFAEEVEQAQRNIAISRMEEEKENSFRTSVAAVLRRLIAAIVASDSTTNTSHDRTQLGNACAWLWAAVEKNDGLLPWTNALEEVSVNVSEELASAARDLLVKRHLVVWDPTHQTMRLSFKQEISS